MTDTIEGTGFRTPTPNQPYHILSVTGAWQSGKTRLACSAPGPTAYQSFDFSTDGVIDEFIAEGKDIKVAQYRAPIDVSVDELFREASSSKDDAAKERAYKMADAQAKRINDQVWQPFVRDFKAVVANPTIRTIVWDTADAVNDVLRLAYYGKIERNPQLGNGLLNAELKDLVKMAVEAKKNFILLHQMADEYVTDPDGKSMKSGKQKRRGNANVDYLVQSFVQTSYIAPKFPNAGEQPGEWQMVVQKARLNPRANNRLLVNADWATLMMTLMPNVDPEVWL